MCIRDSPRPAVRRALRHCPQQQGTAPRAPVGPQEVGALSVAAPLQAPWLVLGRRRMAPASGGRRPESS
eukprot:5859647-Pyramimonas_sp.AAC.1